VNPLAASPGVIVLTVAAVAAAVYAFVCGLREDRIARTVVKRVRETSPEAWASLNWFFRRLVSPTITLKILRRRHRPSDRHWEHELDRLRRVERQKFAALGVAVACIGLVLIGTAFWGWTWD
jgi:hypothetical protein